jgi:hypothetical protein
MLKFLIILLFVVCNLNCLAQKEKRVEATYIYRASDNVTMEHAKRTALERAQLEAIADAFGTNISQHNSTRLANENGNSSVDFFSISSSDVNGEWIETIGEPHYDISYQQGMLVVTCSVKGVIREITTAAIDIKAKVLRNGTEDKFECSEFCDGDDMYLSFQSPVDGYLAVYLIDNEGNAFCLLPYRNQTDGIYKVKANQRYVFFSSSSVSAEQRNSVDEYVMTADKSNETNQLVVAFSTNKFVKANDYDMSESLPRETSREDFHKWLSKIKQKDIQFQLIKKILTIKTK